MGINWVDRTSKAASRGLPRKLKTSAKRIVTSLVAYLRWPVWQRPSSAYAAGTNNSGNDSGVWEAQQ